MIRQAFRQAAEFFLEVVTQVPQDKWDAPGLGVWTVRDLVGHTYRALITVETYSANPASSIDMERPVDYVNLAFESLAAPDAVAERGRESGRSLGDDPVNAIGTTVRRVLNHVDQLADDAPLSLPVGGIKLIDYLPSRIMELTIHPLDLANALGLTVVPPKSPMEITLHLLTDRAVSTGQGAILALASTGRGNLPDGFNVLS